MNDWLHVPDGWVKKGRMAGSVEVGFVARMLLRLLDEGKKIPVIRKAWCVRICGQATP